MFEDDFEELKNLLEDKFDCHVEKTDTGEIKAIFNNEKDAEPFTENIIAFEDSPIEQGIIFVDTDSTYNIPFTVKDYEELIWLLKSTNKK